MIFQIHPDHGHHISYSSIEAASNEKRGWKTVTEQEFYGRPNEIQAVAESLEDQYDKKYGKKPHHRMKPETIAARLKEDTP